jgi:hypothetical protein
MTGQESADKPVALIEGRVVHKTNNALKITFNDGPGDPLAVGVQGAGDGRGAKAAILFGFKNGGTGRHVLTYADGSTLGVHSRDAEPTVLSRGDVELGTVTRGATSTAYAAGGTPILTFAAAPAEATTADVFRMDITAPDGTLVAHLDVIRRVSGWAVMRAIDAAEDLYIWWDRAGEPLKTPLLGTRLTVVRPISDVERDVLLGACVDIALGLRPYISEMV